MSLFEILEIIVLVFINSSSIFMIILVLANPVKESYNLWFVFMAVSLIGWINSAYFAFSVEDISSAIIFYRFNDIFVASFLIFAYQFYIQGFLAIRNNFTKYIHLFVCGTLMLFSGFSDLTISGIIREEWGNEPVSGIVFDFFIIYSFIFTLSLITIFIYKYLKYKETAKQQVKFFLIGTFLMIFFNLIFNVLSPLILVTVRYQHLGDYSAIFFLVFTVYAIFRHKFLNLKIAFVALLIGAIGMLIIIDTFVLSRNIAEQGVKILLLIFFTIISTFLVKSVLNEKRQKEELDKKAREQQDMMDVLAHEVKTPMTSMLLEAEYIDKKIKDMNLKIKKIVGSGEYFGINKDLEDIEISNQAMGRAGRQGMNVTTGLLEFTRVQNKQFKLAYSSFDLKYELVQSLESFKKLVNQDIFSITFKTEYTELEIYADQVRIQEAIEGLFTNVKKYGLNPKIGHANIEIKLEKSIDQKFALITVSDNGIGLTDEDKARLGEKFYRGHSEKSKSDLPRPGGTGLGIFIINIIMKAHEGYLSFDSKGKGKGSTFTLHIPIKKPL